MKNFLIAATAMLILIYLSACREGKEPPKVATQFVESAQLHEVYAEAFAAGYRKQALTSSMSDKRVNCMVSKITPQMVLPLLAESFATVCSDDELRQAISFIESETGKTWVRYERMRVKEMIGMSTEEPPEYSPSEEERLVSFAETCAGKLVTFQDSSISALMREKTDAPFIAFDEQCKNAQ